MRTVLCVSPTCFGTFPHRFQGTDIYISLKHAAIKYVTIDIYVVVSIHITE